MTRIFGHPVSPEMFGLWLVETLVCFLVAAVVLSGGAGLEPVAAEQALLIAGTVGLTTFALGLYRPEICLQTRRLMVKTAVGGILAFPVVWLLAHLSGIGTAHLLGPDSMLPLKMLFAWVLSLLATRLAFSLALRGGVFTRRVLILGAAEDLGAIRTETAIAGMERGFFEHAGTLPADAGPDALSPASLAARRVWGIIVTPEAQALAPANTLLLGKQAGIQVVDSRDFWERQLRRIDIEQLAPGWLLFADGLASGPVERVIRRLFDLAVSVTVLVFTLPLMLAATIAIRLDGRGPIFYHQERVGLHGQPYTLTKFRSMRVDAEKRGPAWAAKRDPRVTRVGAFLRRTRIDELPQLLCVLRGEMSFIGPRPERPHFVEQLADAIPFYGDRAHVKPGLTGWAQVNYPYGASVEDARMKLSYDLYYVKNRSLLLDLLILFSTVRVILFQEGAR